MAPRTRVLRDARPNVEVTWVKQMPRRTSTTREQNLALAREIASRPGKWALVKPYPPTDKGYKTANYRANDMRRPKHAFSQVGWFQYQIRFDPLYDGKVEGRDDDERGAWLLLAVCREKHKRDVEDIPMEERFLFTTDGEEAAGASVEEEREGGAEADYFGA